MTEFFMIFALLSIWFSIIITLVVLFGAVHAIIQRFRVGGVNAIKPLPKYPKVTIIVPAHNEAIVIQDTVYALHHLDYPKEAMEIRVVADNCSDETFKLAKAMSDRPEYKDFDIQIIKRTGTGGKAGVLNDVLEIATGDWICVYDADAMPQENALYFLIQKALEDEENYAAVFGRNKTRNYRQNFLMRCINLEIITTQKIHHIGLWHLFKIGRIPGTNFIIKTDFVRSIGGWDNGALTEDTAISFKIMQQNKLIALAQNSEAFQQEPETLQAYYYQRKRWAKGNYEVILDNFHHIFKRKSNWRIKLEVLYYTGTFFWFNVAILISNFLFIVNFVSMVTKLFYPSFVIPFTFGASNRQLSIILLVNWVLMFFIYLLQINIGLVSQYGQSTSKNLLYSIASYFTYSQLFIFVATNAFFSLMFDKLLHRDGSKWYKTQRF